MLLFDIMRSQYIVAQYVVDKMAKPEDLGVSGWKHEGKKLRAIYCVLGLKSAKRSRNLQENKGNKKIPLTDTPSIILN